MTTNHDRFAQLAKELTSRLVNRSSEITGLLVALLARENLVLLGPPGTAKSMISRLLVQAIDATYFETLLSRYSTPEQLFGPVSLTGLQQDRFKRVTAGYLPEADVAFLDEIFKAGAGVLNTLLPVLNERVFHDEGQAKPIPLKIALAASNEMPEGEALAALWDRFPLRYWVEPLKSESDRLALELQAAKGMAPMPRVLTKKQLEEARAEVDAVDMSEEIVRAKLKLRRELEAKGIVAGDRRWVKATRLMKAHAWLRGSKRASVMDLEILAHAFWDAPEQRAAVAEIVTRASGDAAKARSIVDAALEITVGWSEKPIEERSKLLPRLASARIELKRLYEKSDEDMKARIKLEHDRISKRREEIVESIRSEALGESLTESEGLS